MTEKRAFWKGTMAGILVVTLVMGLGIGFGKISTNAVGSDEKMQLLQNIVKNNYLYASDVDEETMEEYLCKGYMVGLGDEYSAYYTKEEFQELLATVLNGEVSGIGVKFYQDSSTKAITVNEVFEDSPAEKTGVKEGDTLTKVDGNSVSGKDLSDVVSKVQGDVGTKVKVTFVSASSGKEYTKTITRAKVTVNTVSGKMLENNIGYIRISEFTQETHTQFDKVYKKLQKEGLDGLIIDLRDNTGGVVATTCEILDELLPEGMLVYTKDKDGNTEKQNSDNKESFDKPIALLVNGYTASASEIFTAAMQDFDKGPVIGTKTFGKGVVQQMFPLSDGSGIKLTISEYFSPKGREINGKGIEPDITIKDTRERQGDSNDAQLKKAIEEIKKEM